MILTGKRASSILYHYIKKYNQGVYFLPANICPIVPLVFKLANVQFEFIDINNETLCIDEDAVLNLIQSNTTKYQGIVFVRTYGYIYNTDVFFQKLHKIQSSFKIIDDKCLCIPETDFDNSHSDLTLYSTGNGKSINVGFGGYAFLPDDEEFYFEKLPLDNDINIDLFYKNKIENNIQMDTLPLGWLDTSQLEMCTDEYFELIKSKKDAVLQHKQVLNNIYQQRLKNVFIFDQAFQTWRFNILVENKNIILEKIFSNNLFASSHYKPSSILFTPTTFKNAQNLSCHIINLFNDEYFNINQAEKICDIINLYK